MDAGAVNQPVPTAGNGIRLRTSPQVRLGARGGVPELDRRSPEAIAMRKFRERFAVHVGGAPTTVQMALIEELAWLCFQMGRLKSKSLRNGGDMVPHDQREYIAWSRCYSQLLLRLDSTRNGKAKPEPPSVTDIMAEMAARRTARNA
jgi:hypothetical protein